MKYYRYIGSILLLLVALTWGFTENALPAVEAKETQLSTVVWQKINSIDSAYARALILVGLADECIAEGRRFKAGNLLDEAGRAAVEIPNESGLIDGYVRWLRGQMPNDPEEAGVSVSEDYIPESVRNMQALVWQAIAVRYVKLGLGEKALRTVEMLEGEARDTAYVQLGKVYLEGNRKDIAGRIESWIQGIPPQLQMKDAFVHWWIRRGDPKSAAKYLKGMADALEKLEDSERDHWREELAMDYASLGEDLQALSHVIAISEFQGRNRGFLTLTAFQKEMGRIDRAVETLNLAVTDAAKIDDPRLQREAMAEITRQACTRLPKDRLLEWFQNACATAKSISTGNRSAYLFEVANGLKGHEDKQLSISALEQAVQATTEMANTKQRVEMFMVIGDILNELGRTDEAVDLWTKTIGFSAGLDTKTDDKANTFGRLVRRIAVFGDPAKAVKLIDGKKSVYDRSIAFAEVARGFLERNKFDEALPLIRRIPNPYRRAILLKEAAAQYGRAGLTADGAKLLDEALEAVAEAQDPLLKILEERDIAWEHSRAGEYNKAETVFEAISDEEFKRENALKMAEELLRSGQSERIIRFIEKYTPAEDWFYNFCILSGTSYEMEWVEMKKALYQKAMSIIDGCDDAREKDGMLGLAAMYSLVYGDNGEAVRLIGLISEKEKKRESFRQLGQYYLKNGQFQKALEIAGSWELEALKELAAIQIAREYAKEGRSSEAFQMVLSSRWDLVKGEAYQYVFGKEKDLVDGGMYLAILKFTVLED